MSNDNNNNNNNNNNNKFTNVVVAEYHFESTFRIPRNLNLEDTSIVNHWEVKYQTLRIYFVDGTEMQIEGDCGTESNDFKRPDKQEIVNVCEQDGDGGDYFNEDLKDDCGFWDDWEQQEAQVEKIRKRILEKEQQPQEKQKQKQKRRN